MSTDRAPTILRGIGRWDLVALMINITLGAGMLGLPAKLFELTHTYSLVVLALCAVLIGVIAVCFAEAGSRFMDSGGPYLIARTALGPGIGFVVGWLYWISRVLTFATICNLVVAYLGRSVPLLGGPGWRTIIIAVVVGATVTIHLLGIRHATVVSNALTILKVAFLVLFGVVGILSSGGSMPAPGPVPQIAEWSDAMLLALFAFVGFEASMVSAGEARDPRRDTPFAIATSLLIVLLLYLGVQFVCMISVPTLGSSTTPVADAAVVLWGPLGEQLVAGAAIIIMLGSLNGGFLATSRLPFAFAEQGDLPAWLSRVHPRFRTPHFAILSSGALVLVATLGSSFLTAVSLATTTRMLMYVAGCAALIVLRRREQAPPAAFVAPFGRTFAVLAITLSIALLATASGRELLQLAIATVSGVIVYALFAARRRETFALSEHRE
jgi:basic amino acid/polyamine antiporter, APA family